ncbi:putative biotin-dependent acyl-coenzyme A carboxylase beta2 subunit [Exophiala dermatitidis]|uniref:methylcrotonoyl-CoA carboxylase n=1 Tax=Exophiala dermatitidis (strain ATCC 34100 / CBS 525.76 / NIH/UT8656) TaxID=858893 RepID=H6C9N4_EXODN|nr:propionyl-CoA carboxylase beta chain [Exophiala dermatitidis NIH/UT8656]EHY60750.1 propionyl-CoA carboxylase beta chain [Exophiala dermatitidis NIH/UT8656]
MTTIDAFPAIESKPNSLDAQSKANRDAWAPVLEQYEKNLQATTSEGTEISLKRHQARGQLLARDRISLLLDPDTPFLELCSFAGFGLKDSSPCASLIAGIGSVCGRLCLIRSHVPSQSGGAWNEYTVLKQNRVTEIANENNLPIIALIQSAGVFLPQQFKVFHKGGQLFRDLALRSRNGKPTCSVVFGSSTAGGAYDPALSDYTIFVKDQAQVFLGGPPLVKMATGEVIDAESLGGASIHGSVTGLADQIAMDEFDAVRKARDWVLTLDDSTLLLPRQISPPLSPRYPAEEILSLVNPDIRKPFDMREVLLRIVDDSRLLFFKPEYGRNLLTAFTRIQGIPTAIIANQTPVIHADEASKGAQFIRLCNQQRTPIVFLHNVTGFMVGSKAEHSAIIKKGAQFVSAVSCSTVPHISVILGASYGAGNYAMCGRAYRPRFLFTWPIGRCSVMGPDQLSGVMRTVETNSAKAKGVKLDPKDIDARVNKFRDGVQRDSECYRTSSVLLDDGIIDPRDTRDVLGMCLEIVNNAPIEGAEAHRALARM